jgi:hypothetical protein
LGLGVCATGAGVAVGLCVGRTAGEGDADGDGTGDTFVVGLGCGVCRRGPEKWSGGDADGATVGEGTGVMLARAIAVGAVIGEREPPKKCASRPPSNNPAKMTMRMSGTSGKPPPPFESSSDLRRRGGSLIPRLRSSFALR